MLKKGYLVIGLLLFGQAGFAETCPRIQDIKHHQLHAWKLYDSEENILLTGKRRVDFFSKIDHFALAEWAGHDKKNLGAIHCYYKDKNGSTLEAYLTKDHYSVKNDPEYWYPVSGLMECAADPNNCEFESQQALKLDAQFAEK